MIPDEAIIYLLRKTTLTRSELANLEPDQFMSIFKEVVFQEAQEDYRNQYAIASILAAIYNTIPRKRGSRTYKPNDFLQGQEPRRQFKRPATLEKLAREKGIELPKERDGKENKHP